MAVGTKSGCGLTGRGSLQVFVQTSAAATSQTCSTDTLAAYKLLHVDIAYSAAPTYTGSGLTVTLNAAAGAGYDTLLQAGTSNQQYFVFVPTSGEYIIKLGDAIDVVAPSGAGAITSSVSIYVEEL